jgi:uncharacterized protein (TIGR02996 family)
MQWHEIDERLDAGELDAALEAVLGAWRANRHPVLADLIDAIAAHVPPTPIDARAFHAAWLELAGRARARDIGALLAGLRRSLPRATRVHERSDAVIPRGWAERVAALAALPDDPRLARPLVQVMRDAPWSVHHDQHAPTYGAPLDLVARIGDVRVADALDELLAAARERRVRDMWYVFVDKVPATLAAIRERPAAALADEDLEHARTLIARYAAPSAAPKPELAQLLALVYEDPDDDAARAVYGDALLEAGDARGELIAFQLAAERGNVTADGLKHARSVLRASYEAWVGDLAFVLKSLVFERGMLAEGALVQNATAERVLWERAPRDERLATVHTLNKGRGNEAHYKSFVFSPAMRGLRTVTMLSTKMVERMCGAREPWPFTHVVFEKPLTPKTLAALTATQALPHLERITIAIEPDRIAETARLLVPFARARQLVEITALTTGWHPVEAPIALWFASVAQLAPTRVGLGLVGLIGFHIEATPGADGLLVDVELSAPYWIVEVLGALPPIERLVVRPRGRPGTRLVLSSNDEITTNPHFDKMLAGLAPFRPELPPEWEARTRAATAVRAPA